MDLLQNHSLNCPYCGEVIQIVVDCSVTDQDYIEDCQVCCRPINLYVTIEENNVQIHASHENE
jgi:Cysteine-rich CPXCG